MTKTIATIKMKRPHSVFALLLLVFALALSGCDDADNSNGNAETGVNENEEVSTAVRNEEEQSTNENEAMESDNDGSGLDSFLEGVNDGTLPGTEGQDGLDYGLGYFLAYASIDSTGLDTLIYNALVVHKQMADGEISADSLTNGQQNLLDITNGIVFNPEVELTDQLGQSPEVRDEIYARLTADQDGMSPEDALNSNEVVGVAALNSGADIGRKYLVYGQDSPDSEFEFIGVIIVVDASGSGGNGETYSFQGWDSLPLLGDSSGPFWDDIPTGVSGDPSNTAEGRPGVLLISESKYEEIK